MATAADLGISEQEFQDAINLEKMYSFVAACQDQCTRCGSSTESVDLLCDDCGNGKPQCKRLGDSHIRKHEVDKFEKKFGKMSSSSRRKSGSPVAVKPSAKDTRKKHRNKKAKPPPPPSSSSSSQSADESTVSSGSSEHKRRDKARHVTKSSKKKKSNRRKSSSSIDNSTDFISKSGWGTFETVPPRNTDSGVGNSPVAGMMGLFQQQHQHQQQQQMLPPMQGSRQPMNGQYGNNFALMHSRVPPQSLSFQPSGSWQSPQLSHQAPGFPHMNYQPTMWQNVSPGGVLPNSFHNQWRTSVTQGSCLKPSIINNNSNPFSTSSVYRQQFNPQTSQGGYPTQNAMAMTRSATTNPFLRPAGSSFQINRSDSQYSSRWPTTAAQHNSNVISRNPFNGQMGNISQPPIANVGFTQQPTALSNSALSQNFFGRDLSSYNQMQIRR